MNQDLKRMIEEMRNVPEEDIEEKEEEQKGALPKSAYHIDRIEEAKTNEAIESFNARKAIRKSLGRVGVWLIYAAGIFTIFIALIFLGCLILEPFYAKATLIKNNFEPLFDEIIKTLPWILLFIFGDYRKLARLINND